MKRFYVSSILSAFVFSFLLGCTHSAMRDLASSPVGTTYNLTGSHPERGKYDGQLQVRTLENGQTEVTRLVTYRSFRFEGMKVQEIWQAKGLVEDGVLQVRFSLKQADLFQRVDDLVRTAEQFKIAKRVAYFIRAEEGLATFGELRDQLSDPVRLTAEEKPLWQNQRSYRTSVGESHPAMGKAAMLSFFAPVMLAYRKDSFVQSFADHPAYQKKMQYIIFDPTDFEFLRRSPDTIRVVNKVVDHGSLVEASLRRDAYAPTLLDKAQTFDRELTTHYLNQLGLYAGASFDASNRQTGYIGNGDGGLWAGMYAGSQAMRWLVTKDPEAMKNFRRALEGILLLLDVTGLEAEFARTALAVEPGETVAAPWVQGKGAYSQVKWLPWGNNDMVKGVFFALAWAYEVLPANDPLLREVSAHALRLPKLKVAREIKRVGNNFMANGLAAIASGSEDDYKKFLKTFGMALNPSNTLGLNEGFHYGGIADWSGINLGMVSQVSQILIAKHVQKKFSGRKYAEGQRYILQELRENLLRTWATYADARRGFLTIAAHTFALGNVLGLPADSAPQKFPRSEKWARELEQSIWTLREVPAIRHFHSLTYDFRLRPDWSLSYWPRRPWKYWKEHTGVERYYQGAFEFPVFEGKATETENYWKDMFEFYGGGVAERRTGRVDYLTSYWMARLGELLPDGS